MKTVFKFTVFSAVLLVLAAGCRNKEKFFTLEGTEWKLVGQVDVLSGMYYTTAYPPLNCVQCYTLKFDNNRSNCNEHDLRSFSTFSTTNLFTGCYSIDYETGKIQVLNFEGTDNPEHGAGSVWRVIFPLIGSFSLEGPFLRLYRIEGDGFWLFQLIE